MKIPQRARVFASTLLLAALALPGRSEGQISARYSRSAGNPLLLGPAPAGEVGVNAAFVDWRGSVAATEATKLNYGLSWSAYDFSRSGPMAVPETLREISLMLGATHRLGPQWLLIASLQPGLYGDLEDGKHEAFNVPAVFLATYLQSRELAWSFGLRADPFADKPLLPFVGVNWRFAPRWEFTLGFPRAGFGYELGPALKLGLGVTVQGGSFHIAADPRPVSIAVGPSLSDTYLDYREIRVGLSADYKFSDTLSLALEAGVITDQKFDYYERAYTLNGDAAAFFKIGVSGRF
jgi:hypothetical protein